MRTRLLQYSFIGMIVMLLAACSQTFPVKTASVTALSKELRELSPQVSSVRCSFTRPELTCRVNVSTDPDEQLLDSILEKVKAFSTLDHMDEIARKVHWNDHIWEIRLVIDQDRRPEQSQPYEYSASYYRYNINPAVQEVDAYQTWSRSN